MKKSETPFLDRVILHNKNADERLFDMILRIITFVVLIIIIWIYADLVHVKADVNVNFSGFDADFVPFNTLTTLSAEDGFLFMDNIVNGLNAKGINTSNGFPQGNFISNYNNLVGRYSYITDDFLNTLPIPNNVSAQNIDAGNQYRHSIENVNINDNGYYLYLSEVSSSVFRYYILFTYPQYQWLYGYNTTLYNYADNYDYSNFYANKYGVSIEYNVNNNTWSASLFGSGYASSEDNTPLFSNNKVWYAYGGANAVKNADFQEVLEPITSQVLNFNYVDYNNLIGSNTPAESNANHLYLNDIQVGLSCNRKNQSLESSNIIIGVDVDDWISNHMKSYNLKVDYDINFNAQFNGVNSPLNGHYTSTQLNNLALFNNDAYSYGVSEIANDSNFPLSSLNSQDIKVYSNSQPYYGLFPTILNYVQKEISNEWSVWTPSTGHNIVFNDFTLTVTCTLYSGLDYGGSYIKEFDFLTGAESIKRADILTNTNPWLGDPSPQLPANVPESGLSNNNGGYGGSNTSVNVNVSGQKIPMNVQNQQEINNTLTNYTNAFETFSNSIRSLADTESQNNFYAVLSNTVPMIPGVNIFLQYVALTCGVMLILLVLKILLF